MGITVYSVVISVVFFNLALVAAFVMRRSNSFLARHALPFLAVTVLLGIARLLTPIDFDRAYVIRSYQIVPAIESFFSRSITGPLTVGALVLAVWLGGTVFLLARDALQQIRFVRASRNYPPSDRRDLLEMAGEYGSNFGLLVSKSISRPYVAGLFRPVIYLPDLELSEVQWRTVFRHEVQHIRSRDEWKKLFFLVIQALFWWNPLAHISRKEIDTLIELQCDARVTTGMSEGEVDTYLDTLKTLLDRTADRNLAVTASPMVWDAGQMEARFMALQSTGSFKKTRSHAVAYILLFSVFVLSFFVIVQPAHFATEAELENGLMDSESSFVVPVVVESNDMYIVHEDGQYYLYVDGVRVSSILEENLSTEPFNSLPIQEEIP